MTIPSGTNSAGHQAACAPLGIVQIRGNHSTVDQTITSGTTAVLSGSTVSITTSGGLVEIVASFSTRTASLLGANSVVSLYIDGVLREGTAQTYPALSGATQGAAIVWLESLPVGLHNIELRLSASGGNSRIFAVTFPQAEHCGMIVKEYA